MKRIVIFVTGLLLGVISATGESSLEKSAPTITERGSHHRVWSTITQTTDAKGNSVAQTNSYVELATGLNFLNEKGEWEESKEAIEILPKGKGAVASKGQHKVIFPPDVYDGQIEMTLPDESWLRSRVLGLSYLDVESGKSVLIAEITNSVGEIYGDNIVIYPNAFTDFKADLRYTYTRESFEQDVILREKLPLPEDFGLNPKTTRLQVLTEFFNPAIPEKTEQVVEAKSGDSIPDQTLNFGDMQMGTGKAFPQNGDSGETIPVGKQWMQLDGRDFLIEEVQAADLLPFLDNLPKPTGASLEIVPEKTRRTASLIRQLPIRRRLAKLDQKAFRTASVAPPRNGFVLDYVTLNTSLTNYLFKGDATYYFSGNVSLYGTNTTFEGGAVLKYATNVTLTVNSPVKWQGGSYLPVAFVAKDDNSVGETISGSTGNPGTAYYAANALYFNASVANTNLVLQNIRVANATRAISINTKAGHILKNVQLVKCGFGLSLTNAEVSLRNALMELVQTNFTGSSSTGRVEHLTVDKSSRINASIGSNLFVTNSLLILVTNVTSFTSVSNRTNSASSGIFQTIGAGSHYLVSGSTNRNVGTTNINATLFADLKKLTTYPPVVYSNLTISVATNWMPQAQRDTSTNDLPDVGYHYDPLDYCVGGIIANSQVTLTNGVAIGIFGTYGFQSGTLVSVGTPTNYNRIVLYSAVQEQPVAWGANASATYLLNSWSSGTRCRFTDISLGGSAGVCNSSSANGLEMRDCILRAAKLQITGSYYATLGFTNNIIERCDITLLSCSGGTYYANFYNNLFLNTANLGFGGACDQSIITNFAVKNNLFVNSSFTYGTFFGYFPQIFNNGYNNTTVTSQGTSPQNISTPDFQTGALGSYYYPTSGGNLSLLINAGSFNATNIGMYHYTTTTNQVKETNSVVDIGYHYMAVNSSGSPLDSDGDGLPDYIEDANGNGIVDDATSWLSIVFKNNSQTNLTPDATTFVSTNTTTLVSGYALVGICMWSASSASVTNVTYGGTPMTLLAHAHTNDTGEARSYLWGLPVGGLTSGNYNVNISFDNNSSHEAVASARLYEWVNQASPVSSSATAQQISLNPSVNLVSATNELMVDCVTWHKFDAAAGSGQTQRWKIVDGTALQDGAGSDKIGALAGNMSWTLSTNHAWALAAVSLKPLGGLTTNQPPSVTITNPINNAVFTQGITITNIATATDPDGTITNVQFFNWTTNLLGAATAGAGNSYSLNWTNAPLGTNRLTAVAKDNGGLSATSAPVTITVTAPAPSLAVQFITPTTNQLFVTSPTNILLKATNTVGTITKMMFYNGANFIGETNAAPYQFLWQNVTNGNYTLYAIGTNSTTGGSATNPVNIIVNAMPLITNIAPTNIQAFTNVVDVGLTNKAWDTDGFVTNVTFYTWSNAVPVMLGVGATNGTNYSFTWSGLTNGIYSYYAVAKDTNGAATTSSISIFKVNPTNTPPNVWITYPTNNERFHAGVDITITAEAVATMTNASITNVEFFVDGRLMGSDSTEPYSVSECCWKPGKFQLIAKAMDSLGLSSNSIPVNIVIEPETPTAGGGYWDPVFTIPEPVVVVEDVTAFGSTLYCDLKINATQKGIFRCVGDDWLLWTGPELGLGGNFWAMVGGMTANETGVYYVEPYSESSHRRMTIRRKNGNTAPEVIGTNTVFLMSEISFGGDFSFGDKIVLKFIGPDLYLGGHFSGTNDGGWGVTNLAKYNTAADTWDPVGNGLDGPVYAIATFEGDLVAGGRFNVAGNYTNVHNLARLKNGVWVPLGSGVEGTNSYSGEGIVLSLASCGTNLFVGGDFSSAGGLADANGIALWNGMTWQRMGQGVGNFFTEMMSDDAVPYPSVWSLAARGDCVFVAGKFSAIWGQDGDAMHVENIAKAVWSEAQQLWVWSDLDFGTYGDNGSFSGYNTSLQIIESAKEGIYDVVAGGYLHYVGSSMTNLPPSSYQNLARWRVGQGTPTNAPLVFITYPTNYAVFTNDLAPPLSLTVTGITVSGLSITNVEFYENGAVFGNDPTLGMNTHSAVWNNPTLGLHQLKAIAVDANGIRGVSKPVQINIKNSTNALTARDDTFTITQGHPAIVLPVLTNDTPVTGLRISSLAPAHGALGTAAIGHDGTYLTYSPFPNTFGTDRFSYTVTNANAPGELDFAWVTVNILTKPTAEIAYPGDSQSFKTNVSINVTNFSRDWDGSVTNVALFINGNFYKNLASNTIPAWSWATNWFTNTIGFYTFETVATDNEGFTNKSSPVTIVITNGVIGSAPVADISNLVATNNPQSPFENTVYPTIRDGFFQLQGTANGDSPVAYQVLLYRPEDWQDAVESLSEWIAFGGEPFANITPAGTNNSQGFRLGSVISGNLGTNDLSNIPNGIYDLVLRVRGGTDETNAIVRVQIDSQLKIGQFSFSEQDMVIPVNGIPLTVTRTYNSMNPLVGDFGHSWTYALNSMDVVIDEDRATVTALDTLDDNVDLPAVNPMNFSMRVGGGRNVTLTLPDGHRATFQCTYVPSKYNDGSGWGYDAKWIAPPSVTATLSTPSPADSQGYGDNTLFAPWSSMKPFWKMGGQFTPMEAYDIPEYVLTTDDGTEFHITRDTEGETQPTYVYVDGENWFGNAFQPYSIKPHPGQPKLTLIKQRSGDYIKITDAGISHYDKNSQLTRSVFIERDSADRITAIRDPIAGSTGLPVMKYIYNRDTGNLIQVHRLQDRIAGNYLVTKYHYDHPKFLHYITSIEDPRGIPLARNEYDDSGKLTAVVDADGQRTAFIHNTTNKAEIVTDRLGNTNSFVYDLKGNVTFTTNALGIVTAMAYDDFNNKTNDVVFLNGLPYATNNYLFSTNLLLASINALGQSNTFSYGLRQRLEISTDARGFSTTNYYDNDTDMLVATSDALGNVTSNFFSTTTSLLLGTRDALGTLTTNQYDNFGNLLGSMTYVGSTIFNTNSFAYDTNGNQTNSVTWRREGGAWTGATNTTIYDAQNRVVKTIAPDGGTNTMVYNSIGKQDYTVDALNHTNRFDYDAQGRLFKTTHADDSFELSYFDAQGRRTNSVDRAGHSTIYYFDPLGRTTNTMYADNSNTRTVYDDLGRVKFSVDAMGITNAFGYDVLGRRVALTNAWGTSVAVTNFFGYDISGNQPYITNALGVVTTNYFDALNRVTNVLFADGTKMFTGYDAAGRRVAETNQDSIVTRFGYDGGGRLTSVTNALGTAQQIVTRYEYDEAGNQTAQIDALLRTNRYAYDNMGRRIKRTLPGDQSETFGYNKSGSLVYHTNFNGVVITNQYDVLNRLTNRSSVNGYNISYAYNVSGQRTNMTDASGTTTYAYDIRDRLTNCVSVAGILNYSYNTNGHLTNLASTTPGGTSASYQYDPLNRLTNVIDGRLTGTQNTSYGFDMLGNVQRLSYPNGVTNLYQYDSLNRLTNLTWKYIGGPRADFAYKLGMTGNRTNLSETINAVSRAFSWQYDALYRLTNEVVTGTTAGNLTYGYDLVGNRTNRAGNLLGGASAQTPTLTTNDWLKTDAYDNNGNTLWSTNGTATGPYFYDAENHLTNFNNGAVLITYNGDGQRVKKVVGGVTTLYLVDALNPSGYTQVLEEQTAGVVTNYYTFGLDLISQRKPGVTTNFFGYDGHGSTRFLLNLAGGISDTYMYDAYGSLVTSTGTTANKYLYCGEQWDSDLGFYNLRARYLNPNTGRFTTMDSYEGSQGDPQSLHKYLYCHADPANRIDPSGHSDLMQMQLTTKQIVIIAAIGIPVVMQFFNAVRNNWEGRTLAEAHAPKLEAARAVISRNLPTLPEPLVKYAQTAMNAKIKTHKNLKVSGSGAWGATYLYGQWAGSVIHIKERSFQLSDELLAALLVHEAAHVHQYMPGDTAEEGAYQLESDFIRAIGLSAESMTKAREIFKVENDDADSASWDFLDDTISAFKEYKIVQPALER